MVSIDELSVESEGPRVLCRLCESDRLLSVLDLGATPPCEKLLSADELDLPESTYPLHLRLCENCLLLQIPALITPEDTFTEYAYFSSFRLLGCARTTVRHRHRRPVGPWPGQVCGGGCQQ